MYRRYYLYISYFELLTHIPISMKVNAGPMAYAKTFLSPKTVHNYARHHVEKLKSVYR